jgi:hypothetical protein
MTFEGFQAVAVVFAAGTLFGIWLRGRYCK